MAHMTEITCKCGCGRKKNVRTADINRGWGKYYSKSCKAKVQTRRTGRGRSVETVNGVEVAAAYVGITDRDHDEAMSDCEAGWDGHKCWG